MIKATSSLVIAAALIAAASARAEDLTLHLRGKAAIAVAAAPHRSAPFVQPLGEPEREPLFAPRDVRETQSRSSCESGRDLCYDASAGRIVYKAARNYMPDLPGLQPDSISLKRDKITFKYTF